jgi:hypothetical protein
MPLPIVASRVLLENRGSPPTGRHAANLVDEDQRGEPMPDDPQWWDSWAGQQVDEADKRVRAMLQYGSDDAVLAGIRFGGLFVRPRLAVWVELLSVCSVGLRGLLVTHRVREGSREELSEFFVASGHEGHR